MLAQNPGHCKHLPKQFQRGRKAFRRGLTPKCWWPLQMRQGWNFEGEVAFLNATADELGSKRQSKVAVEYMPLSDEPGYSESTQPFLW